MTDADKEKEIEAGGDGSWEPMPRHKPSRLQFYLALFTIASCASSMVTAITSYVRMQAAAAEVGDVVDNWGLTPIIDFKIVSSSASCPSGFEVEHVNYLQQPGPTNLGCGCPTGARYDGKKYESSSTSCSTNQTAANCFDGGLFENWGMNKIRESKICIKRGGQPVYTQGKTGRPEPDPKDYTCPDSYFRCGPSNNDLTGSICVPDTETVCPITWAATGNTFPLYSATNSYVSPWTVPKTPLQPSPPNAQAKQPIIPPTTFTEVTTNLKIEPRLHMERSDTNNDKTSLLGGFWEGNGVNGALPIVEIKTSFEDEGNLPYGLCFAPGRGFGANDEREKMGTPYFDDGKPTMPKSYEPRSCEHPDKRFFPIEFINAREFMYQNAYAHDDCKTAPSMTDAKNADYFTSFAKCNSIASYKACASDAESPGESCSDDICKNTFYQSKCGNLMRFVEGVSSTARIGIYARHQIYWKTGCGLESGEKEDAQKEQGGASNGKDMKPDVGTHANLGDIVEPLARAVLASLFLLIINCLVNLYLIFIAFFIVSLTFDDNHYMFNAFGVKIAKKFFPNALGEDNQYKMYEASQAKLDTAAKVAKITPLVFAIMYIGMVKNWFSRVGEEDCSDDTTNMAFDELASALPAAYSANIGTLCLDSMGIVFFMILSVYHWIFPPSDKVHVAGEDDEEDGAGKSVELAPKETTHTAAPAPATATANAPAPDSTPDPSAPPAEPVIASVAVVEKDPETAAPVPTATAVPVEPSKPGVMTKETAQAIRDAIATKSIPKLKEVMDAWYFGEGCQNMDLLSTGNAICDKSSYATWGYSFAHFATDQHEQLLAFMISGQPYKLNMRIASKGGPLGEGTTALMKAAHEGRTGTCKLLINMGADPDQENRARQTAWHYARNNGMNGATGYLAPKTKVANSGCTIM